MTDGPAPSTGDATATETQPTGVFVTLAGTHPQPGNDPVRVNVDVEGAAAGTLTGALADHAIARLRVGARYELKEVHS